MCPSVKYSVKIEDKRSSDVADYLPMADSFTISYVYKAHWLFLESMTL